MKKAAFILSLIFMVGIIASSVCIIADEYQTQSGFFMSRAEYVGHSVRSVAAEEITEEITKEPEKASFESETEAESEQETSKESNREKSCEESLENAFFGEAEIGTSFDEIEKETTEPSSSETMETTAKSIETVAETRYAVAGVMLDPSIGNFLKSELDKAGIGWWMTYALCCAFQESHFNPRAVSRDGKDKGLFQYREKYWDNSRGDIFDPYAQIRLYVQQTANRLRAGLSIQETISRHMMSDWGEYNQAYVDQVMQWFDKVEVKR